MLRKARLKFRCRKAAGYARAHSSVRPRGPARSKACSSRDCRPIGAPKADSPKTPIRTGKVKYSSIAIMVSAPRHCQPAGSRPAQRSLTTNQFGEGSGLVRLQTVILLATMSTGYKITDGEAVCFCTAPAHVPTQQLARYKRQRLAGIKNHDLGKVDPTLKVLKQNTSQATISMRCFHYEVDSYFFLYFPIRSTTPLLRRYSGFSSVKIFTRVGASRRPCSNCNSPSLLLPISISIAAA